jgi:hypothetical protein
MFIHSLSRTGKTVSNHGNFFSLAKIISFASVFTALCLSIVIFFLDHQIPYGIVFCSNYFSDIYALYIKLYFTLPTGKNLFFLH